MPDKPESSIKEMDISARHSTIQKHERGLNTEKAEQEGLHEFMLDTYGTRNRMKSNGDENK